MQIRGKMEKSYTDKEYYIRWLIVKLSYYYTFMKRDKWGTFFQNISHAARTPATGYHLPLLCDSFSSHIY